MLFHKIIGAGGAASPKYNGDRAVSGGYYYYNIPQGETYYSAAMEYFSIPTTGNSVNFGNLTAARYGSTAVSNGTRGVFGGGSQNTGYRSAFVIMDYITFATTGNATAFGSLTQARAHLGSFSNETRGVFAGGTNYYTSDTDAGDTNYTTIDYITIATTGNATGFGQMRIAGGSPGQISDGTRGVTAGRQYYVGAGQGFQGNPSSTNMDYVTIATNSNSSLFGYLSTSQWMTRGQTGTSDSTRGIILGQYDDANKNVIPELHYITIATTSNSNYFSTFIHKSAGYNNGSTSNGTRAVFIGNAAYFSVNDSAYKMSSISYVTIQTLSTGAFFGYTVIPTSTSFGQDGNAATSGN